MQNDLKLALLRAATVAMVTAAIAVPAAAQNWPAKTVRIVVPFTPGGSSDIQGRLLSKKFHETLGQPFVVDNRVGASGMIGAELVARAPADGYTVLLTSASLSVNATLFATRTKFDPLRDLVPVTWLSSSPLVVTVHPSVPARSVRELVALAKRSKTGLNGGHNGAGTTSHIALEMLKQLTGINVVAIAYKGGGHGTTAILGGEVDFTFSTLTTIKQHLDNGKLRGLAVTTRNPSSVYPQLPTMLSMYADFESDNWFGLFLPAKTPRDIVTRLNGVTVDALKSPDIRDFIAREGGEPVGSTPEELGNHLASEIARYAKVIKAGKIGVD